MLQSSPSQGSDGEETIPAEFDWPQLGEELAAECDVQKDRIVGDDGSDQTFT